MDAAAEALMRAMLHDLANTLTGIRGILEIQDPARPLLPRARARLESAVAEGLATLERSRHMAMGTRPDQSPEPGDQWRRLLLTHLTPLGNLFGCTFELRVEAPPALDQWPGEGLRALALALTRCVLPYLEGSELVLHARVDGTAWTLTWDGLSDMPEGLQDTSGPRDTACRWVQCLATHLPVTMEFQHPRLQVRMPRP